MAHTTLYEEDVARKKTAKTTSVRLTESAYEAARIASGYTGESLVEYVSRVIDTQANSDIDKYHAERSKKASDHKK
jgi:predicted HicB family RNase H-like nuclease